MKKIMSLVLVLALCLSMAATVMAADNKVPSIDNKNAPEIVGEAVLVENGVDLETVPSDHLVITSLNDSAADSELVKVYEALKAGKENIPYDKVGKDPNKMEIRDLFDATLVCTEENSHAEKLAKGEINIEMTLDNGVAKGVDVVVMAYVGGEWVPAADVKNNGDGTITVVLEDLCPIAICVPAQTPPAQTGDANRNAVVIWGVALAVSAVALVALFVIYRKKAASK